MQNRELKIIRNLFAGSLLCSVVLIFLLTLAKTKWIILLLAVFGFAVLLWVIGARLHRNQKRIEWLLSLAVINLFIVVPELALRVANFRYDSGIQFGYPLPSEFVYYEPDETLWWKLKSSEPNVNSLGFRGKEIVVPKPENVYRILFLGDSVTQQGFPDMLEHFLNAKFPNAAKRFECVKLAVAGYSSHQGRLLAEMYGEKHEPDIAFVYYGWNDHWQAFGSTDSEKVFKATNAKWSGISSFAYRNLRILQGLNSIRCSLLGLNTPLTEVRVPKEDYANNLRKIHEIFEKQNIPTVFITAPTSHYRLGVPEYLIARKAIPDKSSAAELHKTYNQIVREVAQTANSFLLDLETEFTSTSTENLEEIFMKDGIHLTAIGLSVIAKRIFDFIQADLRPYLLSGS